MDVVAFARTCQSRRILSIVYSILLNNVFARFDIEEDNHELCEHYQKFDTEGSQGSNDDVVPSSGNNRLKLFLNISKSNSSSQLMKAIILATIDIPINLSTNDSECLDDPALEWFVDVFIVWDIYKTTVNNRAHLLIFKVFQCDEFHSIFSLVGSNNSSTSEVVTHEQVFDGYA